MTDSYRTRWEKMRRILAQLRYQSESDERKAMSEYGRICDGATARTYASVLDLMDTLERDQ